MSKTSSTWLQHGGRAIPVSTRLAFLAVLLILIGTPVSAQSFYVSRILMHVYGYGQNQEWMTFGNTEINTFGVDSLAPGEFYEFEPPFFSMPPPLIKVSSPSVYFDCYWILPPGHTGAWGSYRGLGRRDWRDLTAPYEARKDTWALKFVQSNHPEATISFKWPDPAYLASQCDSLVMVDVSRKMGWPNNRLDMFTTDTLDVPAAGDSGIIIFRIIKSGAKGTLDVRAESALPSDLELIQNYPNPFNPATTLVMNVPSRQAISVKIYDILGRDVITLYEGVVDPGRREFRWDAGGMPSGIYIARIAGSRTATRRLVLAR